MISTLGLGYPNEVKRDVNLADDLLQISFVESLYEMHLKWRRASS